jgi:hypothetical protein
MQTDFALKVSVRKTRLALVVFYSAVAADKFLHVFGCEKRHYG